MIYKILPLIAFFLMTLTSNQNASKISDPIKIASSLESTESDFETKAITVYNSLHGAAGVAMPAKKSFTKALEGFYALKNKGIVKRDILTLVDFSLSSNQKRMWVIDLATNTVLYNSLVAHGRNTGNEWAKDFSNKAQSYQSSLGFYVTGEIYTGKHGISLKLDGMERGINDNARNRAVVVHGADYVSDSFIRNHSRLGRSQGCPAVPVELAKPIISTIKDKSCLFIYHPSMKDSKIAS